VRVFIGGSRGSTPSPGADFLRYGGHTSSVGIAHDGALPSLVLDAGTGLRRLTEVLGREAFRGSVLLSHLHWDHVHGLPFFEAGFRSGHRVAVQLPAIDGDAIATLEKGLSPPHFPITPNQLGPGWSFAALEEGIRELEGFQVNVLEIPHKGGRTFGFRVSDGRHAIAYLADHFPLGAGPGADGLGELHPAARELAADVDVLIHDGQYLAAQFPGVAYLGHSAVEYAVGLADAAHARSLLLFHHAPGRTDDEIDAIVDYLSDSPIPVLAAVEGSELSLP
jgi:phosphoribosyl 1,2-cyclic phosphodiesterase